MEANSYQEILYWLLVGFGVFPLHLCGLQRVLDVERARVVSGKHISRLCHVMQTYFRDDIFASSSREYMKIN